MELRLTLWGGSATSFDHSGNPVLAIKGCKVSDYSGVSLSALSSSVIQINPDIAKCHELKGIPGRASSKTRVKTVTKFITRKNHFILHILTFRPPVSLSKYTLSNINLQGGMIRKVVLRHLSL